ncbi:type II secretion system protein GspJ [Streptomyces glomeratus]|uniref:4Fe-4S ferredoxin-type domain-containing protein n=1 Tax=Streptomyces glomeratus TaxID=284452 RepID=A0ABP6LXS5_9ACTN|nr:type II secretion system protein GspJ [Streptomyces glomeratus]MCF1510110.1 type II secretion system protein GspJ [Streptomyces glomeratus]
MSRAGWAYVPAGSGRGRLQRIASNSREARVQRAYRTYIDHCRGCAVCAVDSALCPTAEELWGTYQAAIKPS